MYSGFVQVDKQTDSNLFYWFFKEEKQSKNAPFVMWINGGPGSSSQLGNLLENGPLKIVLDGENNTSIHSLKGQAWNAVANMVYVDQPVGVGYSYGHLPINNSTQIGNNTIEFIKGFYKLHPEMIGRDFFISGESYGGKYQPAMASAIIDYNAKVSEKDKIPLKGVLIGDGFVDPVLQRLSIRKLSLAIGSLQFDSIPELDTVEQRCQAANGRKDIDAPNTCGDVAGFISTMDGGMDMYDARWYSSNDSDLEEAMIQYLNSPEVIEALHVGNSTKETKFAISNGTVYNNLIGDGMLRYIDEHQKILDNNITLLIFVGTFDRQDGPYGVQKWMEKLKWDGLDDFYAGSRNLYYYVSDENNEVRLGGNFKQYKNLNVLMVYAAGHLVPSTQLALSRNMLSDIIYNNTLLCHEKNGRCSLDATTCQLMNNCTGHGTCITGKCVCSKGYHGADCSITTKTLDTYSFGMNATNWMYFKLADNINKMKVTVKSSGGPFILYTRKDDVPSQSFYNWYMEIDANQELDFYATKDGSGKYIAIFNPDLDNKISVDIGVTNENRTVSSIFWTFMLFSAFLGVFSVINFVYCCRRRKSKKDFSILSLNPINDLSTEI